MSLNYEIQFDNTQDVHYANLMQQINAEATAKQKAANDRFKSEIEQKQGLMKLIEPEALNANLELEIANEAIASVRNNVSAYMKQKPSASSTELNTYITSELQKITEWNNSVKLIKQNINNAFKDRKDDTVSLNNWKNAALTKALFKTNQDGSRSLRSSKELDPQFDYVSDVWNTTGESFIDIKNVSDQLIKTIKEAPTSEQDVKVSFGATRDKKGFTEQQRIKLPTFLTWDEAANKPTVRKGADGLIDENVYNQFVGNKNSAFDVYLNMQAKNSLKDESGVLDIKPADVFNTDGSVKNPELFVEAKRRILKRYGVSGPLSGRYEDDINKQTIEAIKRGDGLVSLPSDEIMNSDGSIKDEGKFSKVKKMLLEKYIISNSPEVKSTATITQPAKQDIRIYTNSNAEVPYIAASDNIIAKVRADREAGFGMTRINALGGPEQDAILKKARNAVGNQSIGVGDLSLQIGSDGKTGIYTARDIMSQDGETVLYAANTFISPVDAQTDINANSQLGTKSKGKAVTESSGKKKYNPKTGKYE